jgi:HAD superfamily hydrolase (TIGR01459 family)
MRVGLNNTSFTLDIDKAEFILLTGTTDSTHQIEDYDIILKQAAVRQLPMICANPDLVVVRGENREICAGALAEYYEQLGGQVRFHGKPYESVYRTCCELMSLPMDARVVGVGDSLKTDVHGAKNAGLASVFIAGGIYAEPMGINPGEMPSRDVFEATAAAYDHQPDFIMPLFRW